MSGYEQTRRRFLAGVGGAWVASHLPGIVAAQEVLRSAAANGVTPALTFFTPEQAAEVEAVTAQIIPTDDTPGAREAGCVYFIDRALTTFSRESQPVYTEGLQALVAETTRRFPGSDKFSSLTPERQIEVLTALEETPFFATVRMHTVVGFFSSPMHGGNRDKVGWQLIGYDDTLSHTPPFGYYDAQPQPAGRPR
jgi:gluconate 2-dehydrogenase gamma chain